MSDGSKAVIAAICTSAVIQFGMAVMNAVPIGATDLSKPFPIPTDEDLADVPPVDLLELTKRSIIQGAESLETLRQLHRLGYNISRLEIDVESLRSDVDILSNRVSLLESQ